MIKNSHNYWHTKMPCLGTRKLLIQLKTKDSMVVGHKLIKRYVEERGIPALFHYYYFTVTREKE